MNLNQPLDTIRITHVMECLAAPERIRVLAEFSQDISAILPYVAALLPQSGYNHDLATLTFVHEGRMFTVYPRVVMVAKARDRADAIERLDWLRSLINDAYTRRDQIVPCLERRRAPKLFDVYKLLPGANCRLCGEATCLALATRLIWGEASVADCPPLKNAQFSRHRAILAEWLGER